MVLPDNFFICRGLGTSKSRSTVANCPPPFIGVSLLFMSVVLVLVGASGVVAVAAADDGGDADKVAAPVATCFCCSARLSFIASHMDGGLDVATDGRFRPAT
jgi:hypothetical protein